MSSDRGQAGCIISRADDAKPTAIRAKDTACLKTLWLCMGLLHGRLYDVGAMYLEEVTDNILYHSFLGGNCTINHMHIVSFVTHDVAEQDDS